MSTTKSIMICSHQERMQKFIKDLAERTGYKDYKKKKINNCSIIKIELRTNGSSNIQLVYWGGNEDLTYINSCNPQPNPPPDKKFYSQNDNLNFNFSKNVLIKNLSTDLDVYIIRHGEGEHNKFKDKWGELLNYTRQIPLIGYLWKDAELTKIGETQAENAGKIMAQCIKGEEHTTLNNIQEVYSSDLKRTQQTLIKFFDGLGKPELLKNKIIVIPCAHEIAGEFPLYSDDGFPGLLPIAFENTTSYTTNEDNTTNVNGVNIIWNKYKEFYGGYTRNDITCKDSSKFEDNFVTQAVNNYLNDGILLPDDYVPTSFPSLEKPGLSTKQPQPSRQQPRQPQPSRQQPRQPQQSVDQSVDQSVEVSDVDENLLKARREFKQLTGKNPPENLNSEQLKELREKKIWTNLQSMLPQSGGKKSKIKTHKKPKKVKVTYKNETKIIPEKYIAGLKGKERKAQIKSIFENTDRPKTSFKEKRSQWIIKFEKKYNKKITDKSWIHKNIITNTGQNKILSKGRGAYYSSGSRPNQTPDSWAYARLASVIMNGPSRKYDMKIWNKYKV
tara:strand:+ start:11 stop:1681 length:1671 start_codon:yes stop_codon:yes gene_type:complete